MNGVYVLAIIRELINQSSLKVFIIFHTFLYYAAKRLKIVA